MDAAYAQELSREGPVVLYDGECGFCARAVRVLNGLDRGGKLRYASLQGETSTRLIGSPEGPSEFWSMKLLDQEGLHDASTAALRAVVHAGKYVGLAKIGLLVPRPIRDAVYNLIAHNRHRWAGKEGTCAMPTQASGSDSCPKARRSPERHESVGHSGE